MIQSPSSAVSQPHPPASFADAEAHSSHEQALFTPLNAASQPAEDAGSPRQTLVPPEEPEPSPPAMPLAPPRCNGWTPDRQRVFLALLAEHGNVDMAARAVGMSKRGAYAFRRRAAGRSFALGWDAAIKVARARMIDDAVQLAHEGVHEIVIRDGEVVAERRRRDPRVLLNVAERLAKMEGRDSSVTDSIALEFDDYLDCIAPPPDEDRADDKENAIGDRGVAQVYRFLESRAPSTRTHYQGFLAFNRAAQTICGMELEQAQPVRKARGEGI